MIKSILTSFAAAALACVLAAPAAQAQTVSTVSTETTGMVGSSGTVTATNSLKRSSLSAGTQAVASPTPVAASPEAVTFDGPIAITATVVPDTAGGTATTVVFFDATQVVGTGSATGTRYTNTGQANLTRVFASSDTVQTTISFQPATADGYLHPRTALVTLNLKFDPVTQTLTGATASIGNFSQP